MQSNILGGCQATIDKEVVLTGTGVHSGAPVSLILHPAEANTGFNFDLCDGAGIVARIPGDFRAVSNVTLCTVLSDGNGASVATVEHLLAALRGLGIDNAEIEIDGCEIPIMDGSAEPFADAIEEAGIRELDEPRRYIQVLKPVRVQDGQCFAEITPYNGFRVDVEISFDTPLIGRQRWAMDVTPSIFRRELSRARTFGFMKDVKKLWACGRALGSSLENTIAIGDDRIINPEGLRFKDEFVRHKALDAIGDLSLAGAPILGSYRSVRGGHKLNSHMLHALYQNKDAWTIAVAPQKPRYRDAVYDKPRYRDMGHAELGFGLAMPAFAAERG